jgi:hypothetical protein
VGVGVGLDDGDAVGVGEGLGELERVGVDDVEGCGLGSLSVMVTVAVSSVIEGAGTHDDGGRTLLILTVNFSDDSCVESFLMAISNVVIEVPPCAKVAVPVSAV